MPSQLSDPTPFTPEYIDGYLRKNDDFQLEIDVLNACRAAGFCANHGGTYQDPTLGKDRQFDIQAEWRAKNSSKILLAVECKNLAPENPFLVSRTPRSKDEAFHHALVLEFTVNGTNRQVSRVVDYGDYQRFEQVGKSICRIPRPEKPGVTKTGDSDIYGTWAQPVQSASSMLIETSRGMAGSREKKAELLRFPSSSSRMGFCGWQITIRMASGAIYPVPLTAAIYSLEKRLLLQTKLMETFGLTRSVIWKFSPKADF